MPLIQIELQPWQVPNYVLEKMPPRPRQEGLREPRSHPLSEVSPEILSAMCDEFRAEIFRKAGKDDPTCRRLIPR